MPSLVALFARRVRPAEGWVALGLALAAALCLAFAANASDLRLPAGLIGAAAVLGLLAGRLLGGRARRLPSSRVGAAGALVGVWILGVLLFALLLGQALPPPALVWRDATALVAALHASLAADAWAPLAAQFARLDSPAFLAETLPRFWGELRGAPDAGLPGARLIAALASLLPGWSGGVILGVGLARGRRLLGWSLPLTLALLVTVVLGGAGGAWLVLGTGLLLALALRSSVQQHERAWQAAGMDYAEDVRGDTLIWGALLLLLLLPIAAALPFTFDNPLAQVIWAQFQPPSGLAELDRSIQRGQARPFGGDAAPSAQVALSSLPALNLGQSLEEDAPDALALQIRTGAPLPESQWPHYWRARVLSRYTGASWSAPAVVLPEAALPVPDPPPAGIIVQEVQDARPGRRLILGLPDIIGVDTPVSFERLADGSLAAATADPPPVRYRVLSRPPELAPPTVPGSDGQPPPDLSAYLALPRDLPPRVGELARTLTRDTPTRYAAALALEGYLRELPYSYTVDPLPPDGDGVDQFLFRMRQGYCTYYASAMAVMARSIGIPARVAIGYATGNYDPATQTYTVYEGDAHAWPELYLDGRWLPFEPTPVRALPARAGPAAPNAAPVAPEALPAPSLFARVQPYLPGLLACAGLLLLAALPLGWRLAAARWPLLLQRQTTPDAIQAGLEQYGRRLGVAWPPGATLPEYGALLAPRVGGATPALDQVVDLLERVRYGPGHALTPAELAQLRAAWRTVQQAAPAQPRADRPV